MTQVAVSTGPVLSREDVRRMSRFATTLVALILAATVMGPIYAFGVGKLPPLRADDWLIIFTFFYSIHHNAKQGRPYFTPSLMIGAGLWLLYAVAQTMGLLNMYDLTKANFIVNDIYTPLAYIRTLVAFVAVGSLHILPQHTRKLMWFIVIMALGQSVLALAQLALPGGFSTFFVEWYGTKGTERMVRGLGRFQRAIGTMGNPNMLGAALALLSTSALVLALFSRRVWAKILAWGILGLSAYVGVMAAQSRTSAGCFLLAALVILVLAVGMPRGRIMPVLVLIGAVVALAFMADILEGVQLPGRLETLAENIRFGGLFGGLIETMESRTEHWAFKIQELRDTGNYWFGNGRSELAETVFDNGYVGAVVSCGVVGLFCHISIYVVMLFWALRAYLRGRHTGYGPIALALVGAWFAMQVYEVTAGFIGGTRLGVMFPIFMGLTLAAMRGVDAERAGEHPGDEGLATPDTPLLQTA